MVNMTSLRLGGNAIGKEGAVALLPSLLRMVKLSTFELDFGPSKVWASASSEYRKPPSEVLEEGWNDTLRFLRELQGPAGSTKCWHARLMLVGLGMVGKTSVWQALQSKTGLTEGIDKDQRTVGVDVDLSWRPLSHTRPETQGRDLELHVWDLGGQTIYQSVHSLFLTRRCIYLLAFRADESDGNGAPRSAEKVFESGVEPWLRLIHSRVPDAHVLLVCTRWCTPAEAGGDIAAHQERVRVVADEVVGLAEDLVGTLNEITAREVEVLVRRLDLVRVRLEEAENELRGIGDERSSAEGGHGQKRRKEVECQRSEMAEIEARLGTLRRADGPEEMSLVGGKVHCIECVEGGDGSTVLKLREDLIECATSLPFMGEEIPARWDGLKKKLEREWPVVVQRSSEAVRALISECAPMTEEQVWEGLRFWELLGFVIVHGDVLVPRPRVLIDFLRPLVHHAPVDALLTSKEMRLLARAGQGKATKLRSEDWVVPPDVSAKATKKEVQQVQELVRDLQDRWVLKKKLLPYLAKWHEMREEERGDLLGVLEKFHLVVKYGESEESWLCACRLVAAEGSDATTPDWSRYENHATVRYTFDFLPRPLFPRFLAMQILNPDFKTERLPDVASNMLSMRLKKLHQKDGTRSFLVELEREDEKDNGVLRVASTNLVDLRMLCCALEGLIGKGFVALAYSTQVEFRSERPGEEGRFKWEIDQKESLASLLRGGRRWEEEVQVENVEDRRMTPYFRLGDVFGAKSPAFFFSHCWGDEREPMLDHLACRIEDLTGERVFDTNELAKAQDFGGRMEDGVRRAQCVFVFLSREYLAKRNCLLELKLAREQHLENGTRVVLIAMEPAVSFEEIQRWTDGSGVAVPGGGLRVHRHTVAWVKEHLLNSKINMEWSVHEGFDVDVGARDKTLDTILRPQSRERAATSWAKHDFELCPSGDGHGGHFLRDKALPEPEVADRKHGLLGPDEEHAGRGGEKKARVEAETGGGASQGKQVVVGFFPEERWDNPKKAIHPLGEAQELSFLYKSSVWDFQLHPRPTVDSFCERMWALLDNSRVIVHFAGHCSREGALHWLKDREGRESEALDASVFVDVMKEAVKRGAVVCVVLNACLSLSLGEKLCTVAKVPHVVCWKGTVDDSLAAQSAKTFWQSLDKDYRVRHCGEGDSREEATDRLACRIETAIKKCKIQLMEVKKRAFKEGGVKAVPRERLCLLNSEGGDLLPGDSEDEKGFGRRRLVAFFPEKRLENISPLGEDLCSFLYASDVWDFEPHAWPTADLFCDTMVAVAGQGGIVHFAGHCDEEGTLCWVRDREGQENEPLAASTMVTVMKKAVKSGAVVCVVLNACESLSLGERLRKDAEVPHVVCWRGEVGATRAAKFALTFYKSLESSPEEYFVSRREKGDSKEKAADRLARRIKAAVVACKGTLLLAKEEAALVGAVPRERLCLLSTGGDLLPGGSEDGYGWSSRDGDTEGGGEEEGDEEGEAEGDEESEEEGDEEGEEEGDEEGEEQEE
ncbi:hypothetical protein T484DRAFT_1970795 [Baffinella frigidus]|nr:hypothetical protein T484DRAFT_1970795 [Cryptophyta sp. CCMP2293]